MPVKNLGTKWTCFKCGAKFYDLKKAEPACPRCGSNQNESPALRPTTAADRKRAAREALEVSPELVVTAAVEEDVESEEEPVPEEVVEEEPDDEPDE